MDKRDDRINQEIVKNTGQEKGKVFTTLKVAEYLSNSVVHKTIIEKTTGNVIITSYDLGESSNEKTSPFDILIQVIDGNAEIDINNNSHLLKRGESIIIPAHSRNKIKAMERIKIVSTIIKSGYEEVS